MMGVTWVFVVYFRSQSTSQLACSLINIRVNIHVFTQKRATGKHFPPTTASEPDSPLIYRDRDRKNNIVNWYMRPAGQGRSKQKVDLGTSEELVTLTMTQCVMSVGDIKIIINFSIVINLIYCSSCFIILITQSPFMALWCVYIRPMLSIKSLWS